MEKVKIIISGGGTGGHIFPALSIAGELKRRIPGCELLFVGALGRMEMEKVPAAGYPIIGLPIIGFPRKAGVAMLRFPFMLIRSMVRARQIINRFKPNLVIGVGGYASGPLLRAATASKITTLIQEQNSFAGITNKLLAKKVNLICVAYEGMERFFPAQKIVVTGNPVRKLLLSDNSTRNEALSYFGLPENQKVLLITGGSLGARSINEAVINNIELIAKAPWNVIWQTGSVYYSMIREKTGPTPPSNLRIFEFLDRMELAYQAADVIVARAGAGTISELCITGKPAVLVPSPNVAEDHQTKNALALVEKEAAIMITDHEISQKLYDSVTHLMENPEVRNSLSANIKKLARPEATARIVDEALKLIEK